MSRYVIQFYKDGNMRYISHLDLLRLFKRTFKRTGIRLIYSQGFNPHPRMSFVQPLSLGYASDKEYLDFETTEQLDCREIISRLNGAMPAGVGIIGCRELPPTKRTLAALVEYAVYEASFELSEPIPWREKLEEFLAQEQILVEKKQKKTGKLVEQDIRPMILKVEPLERSENNDKYISLTLLTCAGSNRNLNPETLLSAFCSFCGLSYAAETASIRRKELYCGGQNGRDGLVSVMEYTPQNH